jgi:hypothetical protein
MLDLTGNGSKVQSLSILRREKYNWISKKTSNKKRVVVASEIFESDEEIAEKYDEHFLRRSSLGEELAVEVY